LIDFSEGEKRSIPEDSVKKPASFFQRGKEKKWAVSGGEKRQNLLIRETKGGGYFHKKEGGNFERGSKRGRISSREKEGKSLPGKEGG